VDPSLSCFFVESFVDELAERAQADPLAFRLELAREKPRMRRVLETAAGHAGFGAPGRHFGIAAFLGWNTYVAQVAEVARDQGGAPKVIRMTCAFDCGTMVNPALVRAQVEGGITMGLSAALKERISLKAGGVAEGNFDDYPLLRMSEVPAIEVVLLSSEGEPVGGAGEPPVPAVAPAVANALYRLTGKRQRSLPLLRA
jgi:CO/xanthine dehydrogenase Mo-binding subunit